ncbi:hypothetical protein ACJJTC_000125 [Scirpophaga incertulas]
MSVVLLSVPTSMGSSIRHFILWFLLVKQTITFRPKWSYYDIYHYLPDMEKKEHDPIKYTSELPNKINGTQYELPSPKDTSDFRIEESQYLRYYHYSVFEEERPYRISPFAKQTYRWNSRESPEMLGCTCTTVYKRLKMLATCAVLTTRHILTTATSTELILRKRRHFKHLQNVLGVWYDNNRNFYNSSMYATPARIHYHPKYVRPYNVNRSHPIPANYDLSVWTTTHRLYGGFTWGTTAVCQRASSHWNDYGSPVPMPDELAIVAGFQFIKAFRRNPLPWMKYAVRTRKHVLPCPKTEWGWFLCIKGNWAKLGLDSGANLHRTFEGKRKRFDGLVGINAFSMKLRSYDMIHYFVVLDRHTVIDFLYNSYMGLLQWEFLDFRFEDTKYNSLQAKNPNEIYWNWEFGEEVYSGFDVPNYR